MALTLHSRAAPVEHNVEPRPLHNKAGTIRSLARQMLMDLDRRSMTTAVPTAQLEMLLTALCDALQGPVLPRAAVADGAMRETTTMLREPAVNPNLAYWQRKAEEDEENAAADE